MLMSARASAKHHQLLLSSAAPSQTMKVQLFPLMICIVATAKLALNCSSEKSLLFSRCFCFSIDTEDNTETANTILGIGRRQLTQLKAARCFIRIN